MNLNAVVNFTFDNYYAYLNIPAASISGVTISNDKIGMYSRDYDTFLSIVIQSIVDNTNSEWTNPFDFRTLDPIVMYLQGVFVKPRVSPFYQNGYLYLGMTYWYDLMSLTNREIGIISGRQAEQHGEDILRFMDKYAFKTVSQ